MKPLRVFYFLVIVSIFSVLISCGNNTSKKPSFELQLSSETLSIKQGESGSVTINLTKTGGFSSPVVMSLEGNPTGVTGNFDPASISDTGTLGLNVAASASLGESTLKIKGTAGSLDKTVELRLTVTAKTTPNPDDTIPPTVLNTFATSATSVEVIFSEAIIGVAGPSEFSFPAQDLTVSAASLAADKKTVTLTTTAQTVNESYALLVKTGITDLAGNAFDLGASDPLDRTFGGFNPNNANLKIEIAGLPTGVSASVQVTGPNSFQQTLSASTVLPNLTVGTYNFVINEVKPDSATFAKTAGSPLQIQLIAGQTSEVDLAYSCTLVTPPDANLDTLLRAVIGKDTYNCADLAAITRLTASSKSIQNIEGLQYASGLTELFLDNNQLTSLSKSMFDQLTALTHLELFGNQLTSLPAGVFDNLTALTTLTLGQNQLTSLPSGIFDKLTSLTSLDLILNQLSSLPTGIFDKLTALTFLSLDRIQLTSLPSGIFDKLTALTFLSLHQNQLSSLPSGIFDKLTALTSLTLFSNQLTNLPTGIFDKLTSLTDLSLGGNGLTGLPSGIFDKLTALTFLALNDNELTSLPVGIFANSTSLTGLALSGNNLASLPDGLFDNLTLLTELDLSNNQLTNLPLGIFDSLSASTELILEANCLEVTKVPTKGQLEALVAEFFADDNPKAGCAAVPQLATFSNFDANAEGWTVLGDGTDLIHVATGGNPGGFIQATDGGLGTTWYWKAPALYYGDARDYIGKTLKFSLKQSATDSQFDDLDVILRHSTGITPLVAEIAAPGVGFTDYEITLTAASFSPRFTAGLFEEVLENLSSIEIRGEYRTGEDTGGLDSVRFGE